MERLRLVRGFVGADVQSKQRARRNRKVLQEESRRSSDDVGGGAIQIKGVDGEEQKNDDQTEKTRTKQLNNGHKQAETAEAAGERLIGARCRKRQ